MSESKLETKDRMKIMRHPRQVKAASEKLLKLLTLEKQELPLPIKPTAGEQVLINAIQIYLAEQATTTNITD
jgi:hypothetical protein